MKIIILSFNATHRIKDLVDNVRSEAQSRYDYPCLTEQGEEQLQRKIIDIQHELVKHADDYKKDLSTVNNPDKIIRILLQRDIIKPIPNEMSVEFYDVEIS